MKTSTLALAVFHVTLCAGVRGADAVPAVPANDPYAVKSLKKAELQGLKAWAPDRKRFAISKLDANNIYQIYVGKEGSDELVCLTDKQVDGGPKPGRHKMQVHWHPNGKWIFSAIERDTYTTPPILGASKEYVEGTLQCGLWTNMWAVTPDGKRWKCMTDFKSGVPGTPDGYTGPALTPNGKKAVWSQIVDGNIFAYYPFGRWELIVADIEEKDGLPVFTNKKDITPKGMHWNEPGNFAPDNETVLLSGSTEKDAQGQDQYALNIRTAKLENLTKTPDVWDEHGVFSPDGQKIIFMSAYPYRSDPNSSKVLSIRTEFMLMNRDGSGLQQLTHFREPGFPEYSEKEGIAACGDWHLDGRGVDLITLVFPRYNYWRIEFNGPGEKSREHPAKDARTEGEQTSAPEPKHANRQAEAEVAKRPAGVPDLPWK
ncbi:MAG: PD40 domain-containing protein [Planctomycetota bacterium]|nr:PD40 domain-containing protein [Planctomycetota bacterium]